jgi:hypothetical protein
MDRRARTFPAIAGLAGNRTEVVSRSGINALHRELRGKLH